MCNRNATITHATDGYATNQALTSGPDPSRAPPWPEVGAKVQRVVGKVERQPAARLLRRQQPRLGRRAAHEACTVDGRGVSCGSQARETSLGRGQGSRMPPPRSAAAERLRHPNGEGAGSGRAQRAALSKGEPGQRGQLARPP